VQGEGDGKGGVDAGVSHEDDLVRHDRGPLGSGSGTAFRRGRLAGAVKQALEDAEGAAALEGVAGEGHALAG